MLLLRYLFTISLMKCIIVDDEPIARRGMKKLVESHPSLQLDAVLDSAEAAMAYLAQNDTDLIFSDIQMPGMTGMEFAKALPRKAMVIFTTAYSEYAVQSYEVDAVDYLMKPISATRFSKAVDKALDLFNLLDSNAEEAEIAKPSQDFIIIKADRRFHRVPYQDILYVEGLKDYVIIHLADRRLVTRMTIKGMEEILTPHGFMRVSKSYIVNLKAVDSFDTNDLFIGNAEIAIGANYRDAVMEELMQ